MGVNFNSTRRTVCDFKSINITFPESTRVIIINEQLNLREYGVSGLDQCGILLNV
jgi:hypothetical protein